MSSSLWYSNFCHWHFSRPLMACNPPCLVTKELGSRHLCWANMFCEVFNSTLDLIHSTDSKLGNDIHGTRHMKVYRADGVDVPGCCLISFHFLWAIHPIRPVAYFTSKLMNVKIKSSSLTVPYRLFFFRRLSALHSHISGGKLRSRLACLQRF